MLQLYHATRVMHHCYYTAQTRTSINSNDNALTCLYHTFLLLLCYKYQGVVKPCMVTTIAHVYEGHQWGVVVCIYVPLNK